jgi:hypothetical protein
VPQYGVWIDEELGDRQVVWRGYAADESAAMVAARASWDARLGVPAGDMEITVLEIEPEDSGYEPKGT